MTAESPSNIERRFVRDGMPWVVGAAALVVYLVTLNRWVSFGSLGQVATLSGWTWQPQIHGPAYWLVTYPLRCLPVAGILSGRISGGADSKIILVGDGDFPVNGEGPRPQQLQPDNINLMVNSVDWLSDETGLIDLRTKAITARPLKDVEEGRALFLKWLNFLLPIILIIIYGIFRNQRNRSLRVKRMEEGYV